MAGRRDKPRILCVDDEQAVLEGLRLNLRKHFEVHTAQGGMAALKLLKSDQDFQVIVSDLLMPGMSGVDFLARTRRIVRDASRVLLTGQADPSTSSRRGWCSPMI